MRTPLILFGLLMFGVLVGVLVVVGIQGGSTIPYDRKHNAIAEAVTVTAAGYACDRVHVSTGIVQFLPFDISTISKFAKGGNFNQSVWLFTQNGKVRCTMCIYGPAGLDGYIIEFGRTTFLEVRISSSLFQPGIIWQANQDEGYALRDVTFG